MNARSAIVLTGVMFAATSAATGFLIRAILDPDNGLVKGANANPFMEQTPTIETFVETIKRKY